jgi:hypothetical protein
MRWNGLLANYCDCTRTRRQLLFSPCRTCCCLFGLSHSLCTANLPSRPNHLTPHCRKLNQSRSSPDDWWLSPLWQCCVPAFVALLLLRPPLEARAHVASLVYCPVPVVRSSWEMMAVLVIIHASNLLFQPCNQTDRESRIVRRKQSNNEIL